MNIYQKMSKATEQINKVGKNLKVGIGQNQYKAVGEADVLEAVKPIEIELGIYSYPFKRTIIETNVFTTTSEYNGKKSEKNNLFLRLETVYRFLNTENPEEYIDIITYGDGVDSQDKAPGKAMTYSDKYALLKAYKIETGDDPDQNPSENMRKKPISTENKSLTEEELAEQEQQKILKRKINGIELEAFNEAVKETNTNVNILFKLISYNGKAEDMTFEIWKNVMTKIEQKKAKMPKKTETNLDL